VTSALPTLLETVDETTAELVRPGSGEDLARGVVAVLGDPGGAAVRTAVARERFVERFTIQASARRMADLYGRVADGTPLAEVGQT
jgi:glycosyltransferase involved in cell wall biosynthesis